MTKNSNYQDLLKIMAIIAMIIDHLGLYFFPNLLELRVIGRYAMPIFAFFAGYNFKGKLNFSILILGSLLYTITSFIIFGLFIEANILISIFLGQIYLYIFRKNCENFTKGYLHFILLASLWPVTFKFFDYGSLVIALMVIGYMTKIQTINTNNSSAFIVSFISILHTYVNFNGFFDNHAMILSVFAAIILYLSLISFDFARNIPINLKIISRHTLAIYFVHILIIQIIWRYYFLLD